MEGLKGVLVGDLQRPAVRDAVQKMIEDFRARGLLDLVRPCKVVYSMAADHVMADGQITDGEQNALDWLEKDLGLSGVVGDLDAQVARMRQLGLLRAGNLPVLPAPGIPMQKGEVPHFSFEPVRFAQERVVDSWYEGGSSGVSITLMRGVRYYEGGHRGHLVHQSATVTIDTGRLILTSKRLIFSGPQKAFSIPWLKIVDISGFADGIRIGKDSTAQNAKPFYFLYDDGEWLNTAVSACINAH